MFKKTVAFALTMVMSVCTFAASDGVRDSQEKVISKGSANTATMPKGAQPSKELQEILDTYGFADYEVGVKTEVAQFDDGTTLSVVVEVEQGPDHLAT